MASRPAEVHCSGPGPDAHLRQLLVSGALYGVGRAADNAIRLGDPRVSQLHARLIPVGGCWLLQDQHSTNGLWWRGRRIHELLLCHGDRVQLGPAHPDRPPVELQFLQPDARHWLRLKRGLSALLAVVTGAGVSLWALGAISLPIRGTLGELQGPLVLYDGRDQPLTAAETSGHHEQRTLDAYPPVLIKALLASEDSRFWWHPGADPIGTGRALLTNLLGGRVLEGGSTLSQQLARSLYPGPVGQGETLGRKWRELLVALQLEARFSKRDLLLSYLNRVYLGVGWGFEDASRHYFAKPAQQLQLHEAALLVGLLPSPNGFDPCSNPEAALASRNRVLIKMLDSGAIGPSALRQARRQPLILAPLACSAGPHPLQQPLPFYSDQVRRDLEAMLGADVADEGNFLVSTSLDPLLQMVVERRLRNVLSRTAPRLSQGAVVVIDSRSGGVLALTGGRDYSSSQFNRASLALRQPGSTFKLFTYLAALEQGITPQQLVSCGPLDWGGQHFSSSCSGMVSVAEAFAASHNTAALRLARRVGLEQVVQMARRLGISSPLEPVPGLVLGQAEVRLVELTAAYAAVANAGIWHPPSTIRQLDDGEQQRQRGQGLGRINPGRQVISPAVASQMQGLLRGVVQHGTGTAARLGGEEGGKTGTTNGGRDLLFVGSEPRRHWVIGIWLGNDDNSPTGYSSSLAAALWSEIIRSAGQGSLSRSTTLR